jgi:hypothetical protein
VFTRVPYVNVPVPGAAVVRVSVFPSLPRDRAVILATANSAERQLEFGACRMAGQVKLVAAKKHSGAPRGGSQRSRQAAPHSPLMGHHASYCSQFASTPQYWRLTGLAP